MPPGLIRGFMALIAIGVIVGFSYLYGAAISKVWAWPDKKIEFPPEYVYVATALALQRGIPHPPFACKAFNARWGCPSG